MKNNKMNEIKWAKSSFLIFILLLMIFNSQSLVNFSHLWDVGPVSLSAKSYVEVWHKKLKIIGVTGPRKIIEDISNKFKKMEFEKPPNDNKAKK